MHKIYFVGAGPGDPELLTLKAERLIREADVIVYAGSLIPKKILALARPAAKLYNSARMTLEQFMPVIVKAAQKGKKVVRLSSGDPSIYGALAEQIEWLECEGIKYEIVPGVSSFLAAAAVLGKELTIPGVAQTVIITRADGRTKVPELERLSELAKHKTTLVIFLSSQLIHKVQNDLLTAYPRETPVAVVYRATWKDQKIITGTLADIVEKVNEEKMFKTAIIIVGPALKAHNKRSRLYSVDFTHSYR